jgi:hypothetical protein
MQKGLYQCDAISTTYAFIVIMQKMGVPCKTKQISTNKYNGTFC